MKRQPIIEAQQRRIEELEAKVQELTERLAECEPESPKPVQIEAAKLEVSIYGHFAKLRYHQLNLTGDTCLVHCGQEHLTGFRSHLEKHSQVRFRLTDHGETWAFWATVKLLDGPDETVILLLTIPEKEGTRWIDVTKL